jgi:hypothetical protein
MLSTLRKSRGIMSKVLKFGSSRRVINGVPEDVHNRLYNCNNCKGNCLKHIRGDPKLADYFQPQRNKVNTLNFNVWCNEAGKMEFELVGEPIKEHHSEHHMESRCLLPENEEEMFYYMFKGPLPDHRKFYTNDETDDMNCHALRHVKTFLGPSPPSAYFERYLPELVHLYRCLVALKSFAHKWYLVLEDMASEKEVDFDPLANITEEDLLPLIKMRMNEFLMNDMEKMMWVCNEISYYQAVLLRLYKMNEEELAYLMDDHSDTLGIPSPVGRTEWRARLTLLEDIKQHFPYWEFDILQPEVTREDEKVAGGSYKSAFRRFAYPIINDGHWKDRLEACRKTGAWATKGSDPAAWRAWEKEDWKTWGPNRFGAVGEGAGPRGEAPVGERKATKNGGGAKEEGWAPQAKSEGLEE